MAASARPFVLVPGACLGAWAWRDVAARLRELGHEVHPVTLTGLGERVHLANADIDLETHIEDLVNVIDFNAIEDAVLVGHSYAGVVVAGAADRRPQRLDAVVYLDTSPLPSGTAIADTQSPEQRADQERVVRERGEGWKWPVPDREALESGVFGSAAGLDEEHLELISRLATPQPYATLTSPLVLVDERPPHVRRAAIFCTAGEVNVAQLHELVARGDPRAAVFAGEDWELHDLATGHWPMFSAPAALAELLHEIA